MLLDGEEGSYTTMEEGAWTGEEQGAGCSDSCHNKMHVMILRVLRFM